MNFPDNSMSSTSTPSKPPSIPKGTCSNEQNSKKSTTRRFMSPTISAASKANPPRKKILAERNESVDVHLQNTPNLDLQNTLKAASLDSRTTSTTEFGDDQENSRIDDSSSEPYDPLTNYLSPRPKFLRYKPNRRREMFLRKENEITDGIEEPKKCIHLDSSRASLPVGSNDEQEVEEIDDADNEEFEEVNEERGCWGLGEILKFVLLMGVLVFSTSYISSMNAPTPSPCVQAVEGVKDGFRMMQYRVFELVKNLDSGKLFLVGKGGSQLGLADIEGFMKEERTDDKIMIYEAEMDDEINEVSVEMESGEMKTVDEFSEGGVNEAMDILNNQQKGVVDDEVIEVIDLQPEEVSQASYSYLEMAKTEEYSNLEIAEAEEFVLDQFATSSELQKLESPELLQSIIIVAADAVEKKNKVVDESIHEQIFDREIAGAALVTDEAEVTPRTDLNLVIGVSILFSTIASLLYGFRSRKNINSTQSSGAILRPCLDTMMAEKCNSQLADREDVHIQHPVSPAKSKSLMSSVEEDVKQTPESRAPNVELLGELVVVEMSRSCGMKSRVVGSEVSSHSVSIKANSNSISIHLQSASYSDISSIHSSHTVDKFLKKQQEERDEVEDDEEEVKKKVATTTTPLRRSSRLRNRVTSP